MLALRMECDSASKIDDEGGWARQTPLAEDQWVPGAPHLLAGGKDKLRSQETSEGAPDERLLLVWECYFLSFSCARAFGWSWIYPRQAALVWGTPPVTGATRQSPANDLGYNSATPGATEIYVDPLSSHNLLDTGDPLMHETLEHFHPFTQTGDANQSAHPTEMPPKEDKPQ